MKIRVYELLVDFKCFKKGMKFEEYKDKTKIMQYNSIGNYYEKTFFGKDKAEFTSVLKEVGSKNWEDTLFYQSQKNHLISRIESIKYNIESLQNNLKELESNLKNFDKD